MHRCRVTQTIGDGVDCCSFCWWPRERGCNPAEDRAVDRKGKDNEENGKVLGTEAINGHDHDKTDTHNWNRIDVKPVKTKKESVTCFGL